MFPAIQRVPATRSTQQNVHQCMNLLEGWNTSLGFHEIGGEHFRSLEDLRHAAGWSPEETCRLLDQLNIRNHGYISYLTPSARGKPTWHQCGVTRAGFKRMLMMSDSLPETFWIWCLRPSAEIVRVVDEAKNEEPDYSGRQPNHQLKVFRVIYDTVNQGFLDYNRMQVFSKHLRDNLGLTRFYNTGDEFIDQSAKDYGIKLIREHDWTGAEEGPINSSL